MQRFALHHNGSPYIPRILFRYTETGWKLAFDPRDIVVAGNCSGGDHWKDWLATDCPALLLRGRKSRVTSHS